jgi:hypothetical protein
MHRVEVWKTEGKQPHTLWGRTRAWCVCVFFSSGDEGALLMRRGSASAAPVDGSEGPPRRRSPRLARPLSLSLLQVRQSLVVASARARRVAGQRESERAREASEQCGLCAPPDHTHRFGSRSRTPATHHSIQHTQTHSLIVISLNLPAPRLR